MADYFVGSREHSVTIDRYGIDPLKDKSYALIAAIQDYDNFTVRQFERGRPDLISVYYYGNANLWWVIMYYNKLASIKEIMEGDIIRIPTLGSVTQILANVANNSYSSTRTISI